MTQDDNNTSTTLAQNVKLIQKAREGSVISSPQLCNPARILPWCSHVVNNMKPNNTLWSQPGVSTHLDHQSHHRHLSSSHGHEDSLSLISSPWITKLGKGVSRVMDAMDGINRWERAGARTRLNWYWAYFFFVRSLRADLCVFSNVSISRSFIRFFLHFLLPCMLCGRVASIFSGFFHCCLHLCTNGI